ncbi:MAG: IS200/IS605 family transposase [Armatimonadetes bacterium]|nr:IS200/IS605 family transposase [Armatimonadota bacterium]
MAGSFTCLRYHLIFSTKDRRPLLAAAARPRLFEYIGGILRNRKGQLLAAGGTDNHVHLLAILPKDRSVSDMLRDIKSNTSRWLGETAPLAIGFGWQDGYGAFTVGRSEIEGLVRYLASQDEHHRERTFEEEFVAFLEDNEVEYDPRYIWQ